MVIGVYSMRISVLYETSQFNKNKKEMKLNCRNKVRLRLLSSYISRIKYKSEVINNELKSSDCRDWWF